MARWLIWIAEKGAHGWACSQCEWIFALPPLLSDADARQSYDRLAAGKFREHDCSKYPERKQDNSAANLTERARKLIMRGFKPKDAVEVSLQEIMLEYRSDPHLVERAQHEAEDFLRRVREGLI